jgi:hypothetical protein
MLPGRTWQRRAASAIGGKRSANVSLRSQYLARKSHDLRPRCQDFVLAGVHGSRTHPGRDHRPASVLKFGAGPPTASHYVNVGPIPYLKSRPDRARHALLCQPVTTLPTNSVTNL